MDQDFVVACYGISMKKKSWLNTAAVLLTWVFCVQAVVWLLLALGFGISTAVFVRRSVVTTGRISELTENRDDDGGVTLCPQFLFDASDGFRYRHTSGSCSNPPGFAVGETVRVRYVSSDPSSAQIDTYWQTWALCTAFAIASVVTGILGVLGLMFVRHRGWNMGVAWLPCRAEQIK